MCRRGWGQKRALVCVCVCVWGGALKLSEVQCAQQRHTLPRHVTGHFSWRGAGKVCRDSFLLRPVWTACVQHAMKLRALYRPGNEYELTDSTLLKSTRSINHVMGHDETPFRLDPRCGSQIKHKSHPNYEQVLFIKSHNGVQASPASDTRQEEAAVLGSLPSLSCPTPAFFFAHLTSGSNLAGSLTFQCFYFKLLLYKLSISSQEVWSRFPQLRDETWHFVITFPGGIYVFIL